LTEQKSQHSAGWYAGALVFWLLTAWLITVGLSSIIPQIFWPAGDAKSSAASCSHELRLLRENLLDEVSQRISGASRADGEALLSYFEHWDERHFRARPSCTEQEQAAWVELGRLRHGLSALLERFDREHAPRLHRLEQLLGEGDDAHAQLSGRNHR
jgi:hypothetical protein